MEPTDIADQTEIDDSSETTALVEEMLVEEAVLVEEMLVEEISIDGMCGVY
jgi:mycofactocin precursor